MKQKEDKPEILCPGCDISRFIETAVLYREFFLKLRADFIKLPRHRSPTDYLRKRLDVYIDVCDRIIEEFPKL